MAMEYVSAVENWLEQAGPWAPALFIIVYALATIALLPGSPLTILAGLLFGLWHGVLYTVVGASIGAISAFGLARTVLRKRVERWIAARPKFRAIDRALAEHEVKVQVLLRLSPAFPFNCLNYALGLTKVGAASYVWTTIVFIIPGSFLYVYLGSLAKTATTGATPAEIAFRIIGFGATLGSVYYISRLARTALRDYGA